MHGTEQFIIDYQELKHDHAQLYDALDQLIATIRLAYGYNHPDERISQQIDKAVALLRLIKHNSFNKSF